MKQEEKIAEKYLLNLSIGSVKHEPDGNIPPDFSVNSSIGVEVRRLNQNYFDNADAEGLEVIFFTLHKILKKVLDSFNAKFDGHSYLVTISYKRPLKGRRRNIANEMSNALNNFFNGPRTTPCSLGVNDNIQFHIHPFKPIPNHVFLNSISSDEDRGGLMVPMYIQNVAYCIQVKEQKIEPHKNKYKEWWLLLVDTIGWGLESCDVEKIKAGIVERGGFSKIVVIDSFSECLLEMN